MVQGRLLDIAVREFGAKGLEGASTRGIAAAAGTAMSSITYHYGGKEGLYLAAADHIAAEMEDFADEAGAEPIILRGDPQPARDAIKAMLGRMVEKLAGEGSEHASLFIVREQMHPSEAFDRIYSGPMGRMFDALVELACVATGRDDRREARIAVLTLFGQVIILRAGRATCAKLLDRKLDDPALIADFKRRIDANIDAILDSMTVARGGQA